jgi:hypothetical protein
MGHRLAVLSLMSMLLAACPQRVSPSTSPPTEHDIDSNDPVDPADLCPPNTQKTNQDQSEDGCPDVDAGKAATAADR